MSRFPTGHDPTVKTFDTRLNDGVEIAEHLLAKGIWDAVLVVPPGFCERQASVPRARSCVVLMSAERLQFSDEV